jgi:hypothetical protein
MIHDSYYINYLLAIYATVCLCSTGDLCHRLPRHLRSAPLSAIYAAPSSCCVGDLCHCLPCRLLCRPLSMVLHRFCAVPLCWRPMPLCAVPLCWRSMPLFAVSSSLQAFVDGIAPFLCCASAGDLCHCLPCLCWRSMPHRLRAAPLFAVSSSLQAFVDGIAPSSCCATAGDLCHRLPCRFLWRPLSMVLHRLRAVPLSAIYATVCRASVGDPCRTVFVLRL